MIRFREILLSLLEEEYEVSIRPIRLSFANGIFLVLHIERDKSTLIIEFSSPSENHLAVHEFTKMHTTGMGRGSKANVYNLANPDAYDELCKYLLEVCHNRHVVAEIEDLSVGIDDWVTMALPLVKNAV